MNNGFGNQVIATCKDISVPFISGSVVSCELEKNATIKTFVDSDGQYLGGKATQREKVINWEAIYVASGSLITAPEVLDTLTFPNATSNEATGSWACWNSKIVWKSDDAVKISGQAKQLYKSNGTTLP